MSRRSEDRRDGWLRRLGREFGGEELRLRREVFGLIALGILDLLMTYALLRRGGHFYESNPVARWWFHHWNMVGLTTFKFLVMGSVIVLSEAAERRRPGAGRFVLRLGCLVTALVVFYSVRLLLQDKLGLS